MTNNKFNLKRKGIVTVFRGSITNTFKPNVKTLILLPSNLKITGSVVAEQIRTLDLSKRWWKSTGIILDQEFVNRVTHVIYQLLSG